MTHRARSSKHALNGQRMRSPQSARPRHIPNAADLTCGTSFPMAQEGPFLEQNYALSSTRLEYSSHGHVQELPWNQTGYGNPPGGDVSLAYSGPLGEFPPGYATCMEENDQFVSSYTASMETSASCSDVLPWTSSNVDVSIYSSMEMPMDNDFDMLSGNPPSQSPPGLFTSLSAGVDLIPAYQSSDAMYSAHAFISSGPCCHGNFPEGTEVTPNDIHAFQRAAVERFSQPRTYGQQFSGMAQQMPLTPPASDHGTPPSIQECPPLSSQEPGHDAYDQHRCLQSPERPQTHHHDDPLDLTPYNPYSQPRSAITKKTVLTQRPIRSASDRRDSHGEDPHTFQPEGNHSSDSQPRSHRFYQNSKGEDGKWHCPFREETNCNHEPTLQKCGFDKYLDSHLKPFVCTHHECGSPRFSSNACLFRHQREAHGLHGHGENPHLCRFPTCERAQERNGFPRKWNLKDHMKRVHGWEESEDSPSSDSPPPPSNKSGQPVRKRKSTPPITSVPMKRQSSSQTKARAASISYFQHNHSHEYTMDQAYPIAWKQPELEVPTFRNISQGGQAQMNGYPQQFGHSQNFYPHESQYPY